MAPSIPGGTLDGILDGAPDRPDIVARAIDREDLAWRWRRGWPVAAGSISIESHVADATELRPWPRTMIRRPPTLARGGMIVASHPLAAEAGAAILRAGGNAIDAVVAAGAVLAVVEPWASGIGGDAFLLIHSQEDGAVTAVNGSGAAPGGLKRERFAGLTRVPEAGPASCSVPGCVAAWGEAWYGWGRLEWKRLFRDAIALASEGYPVSWRMARALRLHREVIATDRELARLFLREDGRTRGAGEICRPSKLAASLKLIADEGAEAFYEGDLGARFSRGVRQAGGVLSGDDLRQHESELAAAIEWSAPGPDGRTITLHEQPLPSQGILLSIAFGLLDLLETGRIQAAPPAGMAGPAGPASPGPAMSQGPARPEETRRASLDRRAAGRTLEHHPPSRELHRQAMAMTAAFALRRAFLADPRALPLEAGELVGALLAEETLRPLARAIEEARHPRELTPERMTRLAREGNPALEKLARRLEEAGYACGGDDRDGRPAGQEGTDTTYLCAADGDGNMAGLIQSIFHPFGCGFLEPGTGILLNNRACGFSLAERDVNRLEPGKRTLHTLNSFLLTLDGKPWLIGGTPGADNQVQTSLQVLRHFLSGRVLWPGPLPMKKGKWHHQREDDASAPRLRPEERLAGALEAPRWRIDPAGVLHLESRMAAEIPRRLGKIGWPARKIGPWDGSGFFQAIECLESPGGGVVYLGATDPRGEGQAVGL